MNKTRISSIAQYFSREIADEQYNPTLWTNRLPTDDLLPKHIEFTSQQSERYRTNLETGLTEMAYGEGEFSGK